ncbi:protein kinase domain-containing protein [Pendulispora albinea]|uniref:Protein kinase n=1 Tax=Pendulispora albinea TaxID=2741071 RepID=A0ABZ2LML5_9BACT
MSASAEVGGVLAGKYRVERVLGAGGMGVVVAARHVTLGSLVALKFMIPSALDVAGAAERFIREAQAAARLRGDHIARVMDFGTLDTGAPYIVMEFLEGADLDAVLRARGRLPVAEAVEYMIGACKAMVEAHGAGIIHRDLKPHNLFLTRRPDGTTIIKVLDFGISKFIGANDVSDVASTRTGTLMGSPAYMSPEQIRNSKYVDARTDIYALGSIFFQLLTGERVFRAPSMGEMLVSVLHDPPRTVRELVPELPADVNAIVARCLQKDPNQRFASTHDLLMALQSLGASRYSAPIASATLQIAAAPTYGRQGDSSRDDAPTSVPIHTQVATQATLDHAAVSSSHASPRKSEWLVAALVGSLALLGISSAVVIGALRWSDTWQVAANPSPHENPTPRASAVTMLMPMPSFAAAPDRDASAPGSTAVSARVTPASPASSSPVLPAPTASAGSTPPYPSASTKPSPPANPRRPAKPTDLFATPD